MGAFPVDRNLGSVGLTGWAFHSVTPTLINLSPAAATLLV
jgi:hypothetical protein